VYSDLWSPTLRQGDVLGPLHLPLIGNNHEVIATLPDIASETVGTAERMILPASRRYVVIVSHDCEFNEGKRDRVLLARIQSPQKVPTAPDIGVLRASNDVDARNAAKASVDGVDVFVIDPLDGHFDEPQMVVFTTITPFPAKKMLRQLQAVKRAEMDHSTRLLLRRKLAWFFLRSQDDVPPDSKRPAAEVMKKFQEL